VNIENVSASLIDPNNKINTPFLDSESTTTKVDKREVIEVTEQRKTIKAKGKITRNIPVSLLKPWHGLTPPEFSLHAKINFSLQNQNFEVITTPEIPFTTQPEKTADLSPENFVVLQGDKGEEAKTRSLSIKIQLSGHETDEALEALTLELPNEWSAKSKSNKQQKNKEIDIMIPLGTSQGHYEIKASIDNTPLLQKREISYPHINPQVIFKPCQTNIALVNSQSLCGLKVGWIDGGVDRAWSWAEKLGANVTQISDEELLSGNIMNFDTIVSGVFSGKNRPINNAMDHLRKWMNNGGRYVSQYHRPWDNWDAEKSSPYSLQVGSPSIRWRITDANSAVTIQKPEHHFFKGPNNISEEDFQGWVKERGLYFASNWGQEYTPLLSMSDPGEEPLHGALMHATVGKGDHLHCALNLFYQMDSLVPGAFRLFVNLVSPRNG